MLSKHFHAPLLHGSSPHPGDVARPYIILLHTFYF